MPGVFGNALPFYPGTNDTPPQGGLLGLLLQAMQQQGLQVPDLGAQATVASAGNPNGFGNPQIGFDRLAAPQTGSDQTSVGGYNGPPPLQPQDPSFRQLLLASIANQQQGSTIDPSGGPLPYGAQVAQRQYQTHLVSLQQPQPVTQLHQPGLQTPGPAVQQVSNVEPEPIVPNPKYNRHENLENHESEEGAEPFPVPHIRVVTPTFPSIYNRPSGRGADAPPSGQPQNGPSGKFYSVGYEMKLDPESYPGSRPSHFQEANESLLRALESDPEYAAAMRDMGIILQRTPTGLAPRTSPPGWTWHHAAEPGVMQLVPREQHKPGTIFQDILHPDGSGGYSAWGK